MSIEAGARAGLIAPDDTTFSYLEGREHAPRGADWEAALDYWRSLPTDADAPFDQEVTLDAAALTPFVTWGTNPGQAAPLTSSVPDPDAMDDAGDRASALRALTYMGLTPGRRCATSRSTRCSSARAPTAGWRTCGPRRRAPRQAGRRRVRMLVVPGSMDVKAAAEQEGLDEVFTAAGAQWRSAGCPCAWA